MRARRGRPRRSTVVGVFSQWALAPPCRLRSRCGTSRCSGRCGSSGSAPARHRAAIRRDAGSPSSGERQHHGLSSSGIQQRRQPAPGRQAGCLGASCHVGPERRRPANAAGGAAPAPGPCRPVRRSWPRSSQNGAWRESVPSRLSDPPGRGRGCAARCRGTGAPRCQHLVDRGTERAGPGAEGMQRSSSRSGSTVVVRATGGRMPWCRSSSSSKRGLCIAGTSWLHSRSSAVVCVQFDFRQSWPFAGSSCAAARCSRGTRMSRSDGRRAPR